MKKLCIVFPGRKYSVDRSLLYYPSTCIKKNNYDMLYLHYDLPKEYPDEPLEISLKRARNYVDRYLKNNIDFARYEKLIFLSKSIGTVIAGELKEYLNNSDNIYQIFLTPISDTLKYINNRDLIIYGDNDQFIKDAKDKLSLFSNSYIFPNVAHSIESKTNYHISLKNVENIVGIVEAYIKENNL